MAAELDCSRHDRACAGGRGLLVLGLVRPRRVPGTAGAERDRDGLRFGICGGSCCYSGQRRSHRPRVCLARTEPSIAERWCQCRLTPISPPLVKWADLLRPAVASRSRPTARPDRRTTAFPFRAVFVSRAGSHPDAGGGPNTYRGSSFVSGEVREGREPPRGLETHSAPSYRPPQESDVTEARPLSAGSGEEQHRPGMRRRGEEESECPIKRTRCQTVAYDRRARGARGRTRPA